MIEKKMRDIHMEFRPTETLYSCFHLELRLQPFERSRNNVTSFQVPARTREVGGVVVEEIFHAGVVVPPHQVHRIAAPQHGSDHVCNLAGRHIGKDEKAIVQRIDAPLEGKVFCSVHYLPSKLKVGLTSQHDRHDYSKDPCFMSQPMITKRVVFLKELQPPA